MDVGGGREVAWELYLKNCLSRQRDLIGLYRAGKGDPNRRKGAAGKRGGRQGLHCGEANPNQRLGGTSGQRPSADSQC